MTWLVIVQTVAALIVLAEALNKIERSDLFDGRRGLRPRLVGIGWLCVPWAWRRPKVVTVLKVAGWLLMSIGAFVSLFMPPAYQHLVPACVLCGFALLIVRSRLKEG